MAGGAAVVTLNTVSISGNAAVYGGGVYLNGLLIVHNSTMTDNKVRSSVQRVEVCRPRQKPGAWL